MKKVLLAASVGLALVSCTAFADVSIGVINIEKIFNDSKSVQAQKAQIQSDTKKKMAQLQAEQGKMQKLVDQYKRNEAVMNQSQKQDLQTQISAEQNKIMQMQQLFTQESESMQGQAMQQFIGKIQVAANKVAQDKHLTIVIPNTGVIYADKSLDITADVEKEMK